MNRVWGYIRVSTKEQNTERQVKEILPYVSTESHLIIEKQSGKDFDRKKYQSLKNLMDVGDTLVIKSIDRLGRNYQQIKDEWQDLTKRGVYIKVLDTPLLDTSKYIDDDLMASFVANIVLEVLSYVAENERKNTKQRQREGIEIARAKGKHMGRPKAKYPDNWKEVYTQWKNGNITGVHAMKETNLKKSTFYKLVKSYEGR